MSSIPTSQDEAREFLREIRRRIDDVEARMDALGKWKNWAGESIEDLEEENEELRNRIEALEARVDVLEEGSPGREGKVRAIVQYADNKRTGEQPIVIVTPSEIAGAAGCSPRYGYDLVDELPDEHHWLLTRQEARSRQYGNAEIDADGQEKALAVDFEQLQRDTAALNKFNNGRSGDGG